MPAFDQLFAAADEAIDALFADALTYGTAGQTLSISGAITSMIVEADATKEIFESWIGVAVSLDWADLVLHGTRFTPQSGDTITYVDPQGQTNVYRVTPLPHGREYSQLDASGARIQVYAILRHQEPPA